jgi:hypothetical protein
MSRAVRSRSEESLSYRREYDDETYDLLANGLGLGRGNSCTHMYRVEEYRRTNGEFVKIIRIYTCVKCGVKSSITWSEHV